jgi:hypothetical protein
MNDINNFIIENYNRYSFEELAKKINSRFKVNFNDKNIRDRLYYMRKKKGLELPLKIGGIMKQDYVPPISAPPINPAVNSNANNLHVSSFQQEKNNINIVYNDQSKPYSVEELIKLFNIDTNIWRVDRFKANKWEAQKTEGNTTVKIPMYQSQISLVRIQPEVENLPPISAIEVKTPTVIIKNKKNKKKKKGELKKCLIIPDSQNGYIKDFYSGYLDPTHDRDAWDLTIQVCQEMKPDRIILLGDMLDMPDWSDKFLRSPEMQYTTQATLLEFNWWLQRLRKIVPNAQIDYLEGNHENRLYKHIIKYSAQLYGLQRVDLTQKQPAYSIPNLLALDKLGITYHENYPKGELWLNDNLRVSHGTIVRQGSGMTTATVAKETRCSQIFGHIHRIEVATKTVPSVKGEISYKIVSPGCICRIDGIVPGNGNHQNWQQGLAEVIYEEGNGMFEINVITITKGKCIYNNKKFESQFNIKDLVKDTGFQSFAIKKT